MFADRAVAGAIDDAQFHDLISNSRKVPAGRVPSEAYANAITSFLLTVKNGRNSWRCPLLAAQYRLELLSTSRCDDAAFTPTLGARTEAAWPCAQSVGVVAS